MADAAPSTQHLDALAQDAVAWATLNGLAVLAGPPAAPAAAVHAPLSLSPLRYPRAQFEMAQRAAPAFNLLMDRVAADEGYLEQTLAAAAASDEFLRRQLDLLSSTRAVRAARADSEVVVAVNRSDYMLDEPSGRFLQVEMNTIASSFGALSAKVSQLHRYLAERQPDAQLVLPALPPNPSLERIVDGLAAGVTATQMQSAGAVLFVVQPNERNLFDQQWLQLDLWRRHGLRSVRATLAEVDAQGQLTPSGVLLYNGQPISLVYFRAGYGPGDYAGDTEWRARELIESSTAAKCPSVAYQLAGAKKVQQQLAAPGGVERFVGEGEDASLLRSFFAGLWSLDDPSDPATASVVADALARPDGYVLKPQREGGGNNLYGEQLAAALRKAQQGGGGGALSAYILMQRILPPASRAAMVRLGAVSEVECLSELGVYGVFVRRGQTTMLNAAAGHLVRTKAATSDEGGVAAGFAVLDSPLLL